MGIFNKTSISGSRSLLPFRYRITPLNVAAIIFLEIIAVFTWINWEQLYANGGWGIVGMYGLALFGLVALLVNLILQIIFRNRKRLLMADSIALAGFVVFWVIESP